MLAEQSALDGSALVGRKTRPVRRKPAQSAVEGPDDTETVIVSAADPLNLLGILLPAPRVNPFSDKVIAYRAGVPAAVGELGAVRSELRCMSSAPATAL